MGFLDNLRKSVESYARSGAQGFTKTWQGVYDLATAPFDDNKDVSKAWDDFAQAGSGYAGMLGSFFEAPGVKQTNEFLEDLYREGVSRPLSTINLAQMEAGDDGDAGIPTGALITSRVEVDSPSEIANLFDADLWKRAYNNSKGFSPGQVGAALAMGMDYEEMKTAKERGDFDNDPALRWYSGTGDFLTRTFIDPTIVGGKAAQLGRLKYIRPMDADAIRAGALDDYMTSSRLKRTKDIINRAESPDDIRLRLLNDNVYGATAAHALFMNRFDDELLNTTIRALYGDRSAYDELIDYNGALIDSGKSAAAGMSTAAALGRRASLTKAAARQRLGTQLEETTDWNDYVEVLRVHDDLFKQIAPFSPEVMADLRTAPLLGAPQMRASLTSGVRTSIHRMAYNDPQIVIHPSPKTILQRMLVSNRRVHGIDVNDANSDQTLRTYLERAQLPSDQVARILARYQAAGSGGTGRKAQVVWQAEEAVLRNFASTYNMDRADVDAIIAKANEGRGKARYVMSNRQEFASADLQKAYGVKESDQVISFLDDDGSYHALVAPILESQMADVVPLADPGQLNRVFKAHTGSALGRAGKDVSDLVEDKLDGFYRLWKPAVLLRLGWPVRAMSDEGGRFVALQGITPLVLSAGRGLRNTPANMMERGGRIYDATIRNMNADRIKTLRTLKDTDLSADERYGSLADAFSEGRITRGELTEFASEAAKSGNVDELAAAMWQRVEDGFDTPDDFGRFLSERALAESGRNWYTNPIRQADLIKQVETDGRLTIDPLSGTARRASKDAVPVGKPVIAFRDEDTGWIDNDDIYDYVHNNVDEFLGRDAVLQVKQLSNGNFELQTLASQSTASKRWKEAKNALRDFIKEDGRSQFTQARVLDIDGRKVRVEGVLGGAGHHYHTLASSDHHFARYLLDQQSLAEDRVYVSQGWSNGIDAVNHADAYPAAWERAVNLQIANDRVARRFLEGWGIDDVMDWVETSDDGRRWASIMRFNGSTEENVAKLWAMVDEYVPDKGDLRKRVLRGNATYADLHNAVKDDSLKPQVHGERMALVLGKHKIQQMGRSAVNKAMKGLGSLPNDKLVRYPFLKERYELHIRDLLKNETRQLGKDEMLSTYVLGELESSARKRALADLRKWMYNADTASASVQGLRHLAPFGNAWQDSLRAWSGIAFREKPQSIGYLWNLWQTPERAGLIVDAEGRTLEIENGKEVWYEEEVDAAGQPTGKRKKYTGPQRDRYVELRLPSWATPDQFGDGVKYPIRINKKSFNTFIHPDNPGFGPIVQVPVGEIVKENPKLSENELAKRILPYGPQDSIVKQFLPTALKEAVEAYNGEDDSKFQAQALAIYQTEAVRYNQGERSTKPTWKEAIDKTRDMKLLRVMSAMTLPVSPQYLSPYQAHIDAHRQLMARDFRTADQEFYKRYGEDFFALTMRVSKSAEGLPATLKSVQERKKYEDLIEKYPDLAGAIVGDVSGAFSKAAYEYQKAHDTGAGTGKKQRSIFSLRESVEDAESRLGWIKFTAFMDTMDAELADRGLTSLNDNDAEDLKELKDAFIETMKWSDEERTVRSKWYEEYSTTDRTKQEERLAQLREIVTDKRLINRDDMQGLADYLIAWDEFSVELTSRDLAGGAKTLTAKSNQDLAELWQDTVFGLKERNLSFAALYNRYLFSFSPEAGEDLNRPFGDENTPWMSSTEDVDLEFIDDLRPGDPLNGFEEEEE